jgi:hypothetical protein
MLDAIWQRRRDILEVLCASFVAWWLLYAANCVGYEYQTHHYDTHEKSAIFLISFIWSPFGAIGFFISSHRDGIVAGITTAATVAIAWFTATIWSVNRSQLVHSHQVERAYISGGGSPEVRVTNFGTQTVQTLGISTGGTMTVPIAPERTLTGNFEIRVNNYGKTPGELWGVQWGFCEANAIPPEPDFFDGNFHDWIQPGVGNRPLGSVPIPQHLKQPAIYGRFTYRDIFNQWHSAGFIQSIGPGENTRPILAPRIYTEERDEPDQRHRYTTP